MIGDVRRWGSHWPALVAAVTQTRGPILELGAGWTSTPLLASIRGNRPLLTVESDLRWANTFRPLAMNGHDIIVVSEKWPESEYFWGKRWSVALVDSQPDELRGTLAERLTATDVVIVHDVQQPEIAPWWARTKAWPHRHSFGLDPMTGILTNDRALLDRIIVRINSIF